MRATAATATALVALTKERRTEKIYLFCVVPIRETQRSYHTYHRGLPLLSGPENITLLRKVESHCTDDHLFDWSGFNHRRKPVDTFYINKATGYKPVKQEVRRPLKN